VAAELSIYLDDPVSTTTVQRELKNPPSIHGKVAVAKPLITENNAKWLNVWCDDHKTWTSDDWKSVIRSD
jgi:hypothetical protein